MQGSRLGVHLPRILLEARANIDQPDIFGYNPLSAAAEEGMLEVVKILCQNQANVTLAFSRVVGG